MLPVGDLDFPLEGVSWVGVVFGAAVSLVWSLGPNLPCSVLTPDDWVVGVTL